MRIAFWRAKTKKASEITEGRFPVDRLPALTDEKIWKGTGGNVEEIDVPAAGKSIATGNYVGDGNIPVRQITTGFICSLVMIVEYGTGNIWGIGYEDVCIVINGGVQTMDNGTNILTMHVADGFIVSGQASREFNTLDRVFYYWAISE